MRRVHVEEAIYKKILRGGKLRLRLMKGMRTLMDHIQDPRRLLVKMRCRRFRREATIRTDLQSLTRRVTVQNARKSIYHTFHWRQYTLGFDLVVEDVCGDLGPDDIWTDGIECNALLWEIFTVAADEANDTTRTTLECHGIIVNQAHPLFRCRVNRHR